MKICICGKGGSGKSTVVSLLAYSYKRQGKKVFVLDSDESNSSLYWMLGFDQPPRDLMDFAGGKKIVKQKMRSGFSKGEQEAAMSTWDRGIADLASIPSEFMCSGDRINLLVTGKIHHALEGCACPMGSVTREFVKNIVLKDDEVMLVDTEAGIEHFGRGVEAGADCVVGIVEPSLESITLAKTIKDLTLGSDTLFKGVIVNKLNSLKQKELVINHLHKLNINLLGSIDFLADLQDACLEGKPLVNLNSSAVFDNIAEELLH
ncbi:MAG: ATP-binding protein [Bacteroidales bacterium]